MKIHERGTGLEKIGFCILHYGSQAITERCIASINMLEYENKEIVVVDNNSQTLGDDFLRDCCHEKNKLRECQYLAPQDDAQKLAERDYEESVFEPSGGGHIKLIRSDINLGFARGNNLGFRYLKKMDCDYILLLNNDVYFLQKDFCQLLISLYNKYRFAVAGPLICTPSHPDGGFDNPGRMKGFSLTECNHLIKSYKRELFLRKIGIWESICKILRKDRKLKAVMEGKNNREICKDTVLSGCAMFFSRDYIDLFDGLDCRTFMYCEEHILFEHVIHSGLHTYFFPELKIYHEHEVATKEKFTSSNKKNIWRVKNAIDSMNVLIDVIKQHDCRTVAE